MKRTIVSLGSVVVLGVAMAAAQNTQPPAGTQTGNVSGHTATTETQNNTAGSISGNAGTATKPAGQDPTKPTSENSTPASTGAQQAPAAGSTQTTSGDAAQSSTFGDDAATLKGQLDSAFQSEPTLSGSSIQVNVTDSSIELTGSVPTGREKTTAKRIAQSYAGNRKVIERLSATGRGNTPASTTPPNQMQQQQQTPPPQSNKQGDANPTVPQKK